MKITAYQRERLTHINYMMDDLYDKLDSLYEEVADEEYTNAVEVIDALIQSLADIKESIVS
tara:strand:+ start:1158 stop:1340 length:183 start_codon:yes stop_codon:yes gene_type:complete